MPATIAAQRIDRFADEARKLGCKVNDEIEATGRRTVQVTGAHWLDADSVIVSFSPAASKEGKGRRDSLHCTIFSRRKYPRKGYSTVEFHEAMAHIEGLKDYTAHTHCRPGRHVCDEPRCTHVGTGDKVCRTPRSLHYLFNDDHSFTAEVGLTDKQMADRVGTALKVVGNLVDEGVDYDKAESYFLGHVCTGTTADQSDTLVNILDTAYGK